MNRIIARCPGCQDVLRVSTLKCSTCGMEIKNDFDLSVFDLLDAEQYDFLLAFLRNRGSLKDVQSELQISYPAAKKKLDGLLISLNLSQPVEKVVPEEIDMSNLKVDYTSTSASEIIKAKIKECNGHVTVYTARGLPCEIYAGADGVTFTSDKLPIKPAYEYRVFDVIVDLLREQGGSARKGNGRNFKLGEPGCEESTVVGAIGLYRGNKKGDSVFDPVFVMAAVLEWAGIIQNGRGYIELTDHYKTERGLS